MSKNPLSQGDLIKAQTEYIKLLENECSRMSIFCHIHGNNPKQEDIIKGKQLREEIKLCKQYHP